MKISSVQKELKQGFDLTDCNKVIEIFLRHQKEGISYGLTRSYTNDDMLNDFKIGYSQFIIHKIKADAPTTEQLRKFQDPMRSKATSLRNSLVNVESHHFFSSLIYSKFRKPLHEVDDVLFHPAFEEMRKHVNEFVDHLNWFLEHLEPFREEALIYPIFKDSRIHPETVFIKELSSSLTKHFGPGGYAQNDNGGYGWRIEAILFLFDRVGITISTKQIYDVISKR